MKGNIFCPRNYNILELNRQAYEVLHHTWGTMKPNLGTISFREILVTRKKKHDIKYIRINFNSIYIERKLINNLLVQSMMQRNLNIFLQSTCRFIYRVQKLYKPYLPHIQKLTQNGL